MKHMNKKVLLPLLLALISAIVLCGCMDRREDGSTGGAAGAGGPETEDRGSDTGTGEAAPSTDTTETDTPETDAPETDAVPTLTENKKDEIAKAYVGLNPDGGGVSSITLYGDFDGVLALMIYRSDVSYTQALWEETVDGVTFHYTDGNYIVVYDGTSFMRLSEAFEKGLLAHEDLVLIASRRPVPGTNGEEK